ncbi:hypothetical protein [Bdellovibrio bacteriovorus]|uniref:hypothetical protein n=1 Tax=Bdellovibrio bacteriovorus TaxID=959 RepID=UPI003AA8A1C3
MKKITKISKRKKVAKKEGAQYLTIRIANENLGLKEGLEVIAAKEEMSLNELINIVLSDFWKANR